MPKVLVALALLIGCQSQGGAKKALPPCAKPGQQCRLPAGGLGVCTRAADQSRFDCVSQH